MFDLEKNGTVATVNIYDTDGNDITAEFDKLEARYYYTDDQTHKFDRVYCAEDTATDEEDLTYYSIGKIEVTVEAEAEGTYIVDLTLLYNATYPETQYLLEVDTDQDDITTTATAVYEFTNQTYYMKIIINKYEADGKTAFDSAVFRVYDNTVKKYIDKNGNYQDSAQSITVSGSKSITVTTAKIGDHDISIREIGLSGSAKSEGYYVVDTTQYDRDTITVTASNTRSSNAASITFSFTNSLLSLTITKIDYAVALTKVKSTSTSDFQEMLDTTTGVLTYGESIQGANLAGATFIIYYADERTYISDAGGETDECSYSATNPQEFTTDSNGQITITGLKQGKYIIYEVGTADGYDLSCQYRILYRVEAEAIQDTLVEQK